MAKSFIFSNPSFNLNISPLSIYVLLERGGNLKNREILKKIEKRKTITGNIFSVKAVRKDLVVGGESRKALKDALGKANIIAQVLNPGSSVPEYLYSRINFDPDNIDNTANQIREFIRDLCKRDIEFIKSFSNTYLISAKNELIHQLSALEEYLSKEIIKAGKQSIKPLDKLIDKIDQKKFHPTRSNFRNGLSHGSAGFLSIGEHSVSSHVAEPEYYQEDDSLSEEKVSFAKKPFLRILSDLGWSYEDFKDKIKKANEESIINTKDIILRIKEKTGRERCPKLELEINKDRTVQIKIGTKDGCIFYASILLSMYEGKRFKRSDLTDIVENVKNKFKEKGTLIFSKDDYDSIPNLRRFEDLYKALLGSNSGTFVCWCIEEFTNRRLDTGASHLRRNIIETLKKEELLEIKDLLLIQKKTIYDKNNGSHNSVYWINLPIDQVDLSGDRWAHLKKEFSKSNPSVKNSYKE